MKILVLGDTHGNTQAAVQAVKYAKEHDTKTIMQVGDFGLWTHFEDGVKFIDTLNESLRLNGVKMYVVGGNHENWEHWNWIIDNSPKDYHGFSYLRSHIRLAPKVHYWVWEGKSCLAVGGAVSIDKPWRVGQERMHQEQYKKDLRKYSHLIGKHTMWWPGEQLTDEELESVFPNSHVDYLFTHDCSNRTPFHGRLKPDLDSQAHRQKIDEVLKRSTPSYHWHGHMHNRYNWMNLVGDNKWTRTYGLECDGDWDNMGVLETDTNEFKFRSNIIRDSIPKVAINKLRMDDNF